MTKLSSLAGRFTFLFAVALVAVGCAADTDEEPEEEGSTESHLTKHDKAMTQVEEYAGSHGCTPSIHNGDTMVDCPMSSRNMVWDYANKKLGAKNVYGCGRAKYDICIKQ